MVMRYTFILEDDEDAPELGPNREIRHVIVGEQTWDELLPHFDAWLKSVGYILDGKHVAMVDND